VSAGQPRSLLFPGVLALIVVLGVSLVVYARQDRIDNEDSGVPQLGDHIHQAFAITTCDSETSTIIPEFESEVGIHTHGDGVLHIHPFSQLGVGANATLGRFLEDAREAGIDVSVSDTKLTIFDETFEEGKTKCKGVEDPVLRMAYWEDVQDPEAVPEITTGDFNDLRLTTNGAGITLFYGDPDADIPKPPSASNLADLGAADGPSNLGTDPETGQTTTTVPGETTTTAAGDTTTTTAAGGTTTTTAAP
jgi:hypothetical protein